MKLFCTLVFATCQAATGVAAERTPADWTPGATIQASVIQVIDGDTLRVRGNSGVADVRIHGIDAPEWNQECADDRGETFSCGKAATDQMVALLQATAVPCNSSHMHVRVCKGWGAN